MKKCLQFLTLFLIFTFIFNSCRNEDEKSTVIPLTYLAGYIQKDDGAKISLNTAQVVRYKSADSEDPNHYSFLFTATDTVGLKGMAFNIYFPQSVSFDGTYNTSTPVRLLDDVVYTELTNLEFDASSANCILTKNSQNKFTLSLQVTLTNGSKIKVQFSDFVVYQEVSL